MGDDKKTGISKMSQTAQKGVPVVAGVKCMVCGALHDSEKRTFLAIYGDVTVGVEDRISDVCPNVNDKAKVTDVTILCRSEACARKVFNDNVLLGPKEVVKK